MDLLSGVPYWPRAAGELGLFPPLAGDSSCEVAIIGGGVTGALLTWHLVQAGFDVLLLDRRDIGCGSTAASTGLLQYEIDTHLIDLTRQNGPQHAQLAYRACAHAIDELMALDAVLGHAGRVEPRQSLYVASRRWHAVALRRESQARRAIGLSSEVIERAALRERFGISAQLALLSRPAAQLDTYRFTHALLEAARLRGARVHDRTAVSAAPELRSDGQWLLQTSRNGRILARQVLLAGGFESRDLLPQLPRYAVRSTYAFISEPLHLPESLVRTLIWESSRPYLYLRSVGTDRLMVGGADDLVDVANRRDRRLPSRVQQVLRQLKVLLPALAPEIGMAWGGTFGETHDGLPFVGPVPDLPGVFAALAFGGNGIVYGQLAAQMALAWLKRQDHPLAPVFRLDRP